MSNILFKFIKILKFLFFCYLAFLFFFLQGDGRYCTSASWHVFNNKKNREWIFCNCLSRIPH